MCGIVGYIGNKKAEEIIVDGLSRLEYRGYDSAGVSFINNTQKIKTIKCTGKIKVLKNKLKKNYLEGKVGIGHTRWATHGQPNEVNAHPHFCGKQKIAVVHNGIIENYKNLKKFLNEKGHSQESDLLYSISKTECHLPYHLFRRALSNSVFFRNQYLR